MGKVLLVTTPEGVLHGGPADCLFPYCTARMHLRVGADASAPVVWAGRVAFVLSRVDGTLRALTVDGRMP
jgi:hypothetical protein